MQADGCPRCPSQRWRRLCIGTWRRFYAFQVLRPKPQCLYIPWSDILCTVQNDILPRLPSSQPRPRNPTSPQQLPHVGLALLLTLVMCHNLVPLCLLVALDIWFLLPILAIYPGYKRWLPKVVMYCNLVTLCSLVTQHTYIFVYLCYSSCS